MSELDKYTEYKTVLTVIAIIRCNGKILLLKRAMNKKIDPGFYSGVGGKVEPGESFLDAVEREVKEETGLSIPKSQFKLNGLIQIPDSANDVEWIVTVFTTGIEKEVVIPTSDDGEFFWITPSKLHNLQILPDLKDYLEMTSKNPSAFVLTYIKYDDSGDIAIKNTTIY